MAVIYLPDYGTKIRLTLNSNIAGYSSTKFKFLHPDGTEFEKPCDVESEPNGIIWYTTSAGDFTEAGEYLFQGEIIFSTSSHLSSTNPITVKNKFN